MKGKGVGIKKMAEGVGPSAGFVFDADYYSRTGRTAKLSEVFTFPCVKT